MNLNDMKFAVIDNDAGDSKVLGLFTEEEDAKRCAAALSEDPEEPLQILSRDKGEFYIDTHVEATTSIELWP